MNEIPKAYNPQEVENKWYSYWYEHKLYHSEPDPNKEPYTIVIPPPNITGILHIGHILNNTIQDVYIRMKRMQGFNACWVPGTDHASIATESKVVNMLKEQGIDKFEIGREEFLKHCFIWKDKYGGIIIEQLKKLGVSCDWDRLRFTMDDDYYKLVVDSFIELYNDGKIYRGSRLVNWDPATRSAISDEEVEFREVNGKLWHIKYLIKGTNEFLVAATTRPETMLGDTAIAVHPNDERYKHLIGKTALLPIVGREIPVIADEYVDMTFGTGTVKITPAHDVNDYEMGKRHNLEFINIFNDDATTNDNVPVEFRGLDRYKVREKVVALLKEEELLVKEEDYKNKVGYSQRGGVPIEPYYSEQWFMKMDELVKPAIDAVKDGKVNFHPDHWKKTYFHWMEGIKDWCISRQLWWGHSIPVYYCNDCNGEPIAAAVKPEKCPHCNSTSIRKDDDVLDTWSSSWLWAYGVFRSKEEQNYYYPTNLLVTGPDIIFFWVARMIIAGYYFKNDIPFKDVYFTSIIRDELGRKMSKQLGNSPDPLEVIQEYGADALRFSIIFISPIGTDVKFGIKACEIGRNFANKLWNAARYLLMNAETIKVDQSLVDKHIDFADKWIMSRFNKTIIDINKSMDTFVINNASKVIYSFIWSDFCDWYIELSKSKLYSDNEEVKSAVLTRMISLFESILKIVHPFMPFVSEELWQLMESRKAGESISVSSYPSANEMLIDEAAENEMEVVQNIINAIRNVRGELNVAPSKQIKVLIKSDNIAVHQIEYIKKLARVEELVTGLNVEKPKASASAVIKDMEIFLPLEGIIDLDVERARLQKEISRLEGSVVGVNKKLSNENFVKNAAAEIVEKEKDKLKNWTDQIEKLKINLQNIS